MATANDPMIDEVRSIRREWVAGCGGDVDRMVDQLREIEKAWRERSGPFADIPMEPGEEMFPDKVERGPDAIIDDVRKLRR